MRKTSFRIVILVLLMSAMGILLASVWGNAHKMGATLTMILLVTTIIGVLFAIPFTVRTWCFICPMGSMACWIGREKHVLCIDVKRCTECGLCSTNCPMNLSPFEHRTSGFLFDGDCIKCSSCVVNCPHQALSFDSQYKPNELFTNFIEHEISKVSEETLLLTKPTHSDDHPQVFYLNNAATSWPKAPEIANAMLEVLQSLPNTAIRGTVTNQNRCELGPRVQECRELLATHLDITDIRQIVLTSGATQALNLAIWGIGLTLPSDARIITSVAEHNAVLRPLRHLQKWRNIELVTLGLDSTGALDSDEFASILTERTALVVFTHASNVTGRIYDVASLFQKAKTFGAITMLDASQSIGHIPVLPKELHADIIAFPGHKGLHGPAGVGALYVAPDIEIEPLIVGGTGEQSDLYYHPVEMPSRLEAGTPNIPAITGLTAALRWHIQNNASFNRHADNISVALRSGLREIPGVILYDDYIDAGYVPVVSFRLDGLSVIDSGQRLMDEFNIICRTGLHCAPLIHQAMGTAPEGTIRFSISGFTTENEISHVLRAVRLLSKVATPAIVTG
jgi:cysteine desulfurase family protein